MSQNEFADLSAFAVEDQPEPAEKAAPEDFSKYEVEAKQPALNNGDLSKFAGGFPDFVVTVNQNVADIIAEKIAERKAAVNKSV